MFNRCARLALRGLLVLGMFAPLSPAAPAAIPDFCFLQVSDIHLGPVLKERAISEEERSIKTLAWVCEQAKTAQHLDAPDLSLPAPAFVLATGDLTEYGVIAKTWNQFDQAFKPLDLPVYIVPGNHDNTWTSIMPIMRRRHGADNYSFDKFGCHFIGLDTATIQEPLPNLEARTLNWLRQDLGKLPADQPIFIFQHHPLGTNEFATPYEQLQFLDVLRGRNVVLLLMGHGHGVRAERWNTLDSVMGGSTFGPNTGYSIISVVGGVLRVNYRYADATKPMQKLLEKPIAPQASPTLEILAPAGEPTVRDASISVKVEVRGITPETIPADIDGQKENSVVLTGADGHFSGSISMQGLLPGFHYLHAKIEGPGDLERAVPFLYWPERSKVQARNLRLPAGMQAGPVAVEKGWLLATTDGRVTLIPSQPEFRDPMHLPGPLGPEQPQEVYPPGAEIIRSPAVVDGSAYFSSAERGVICVDLSGKLNWKRELGAAVYGTPAVTADAVYVGDMEGRVHALDRKAGEVKWTKPIATFGIEIPLLAHQGVLYFGSWDGQLYAVNAADGARQWAAPGPAGHEEQKTLHSRYYAPADCPPLIIGQRLFVVDRSYRLGSYTLEGKYLGRISEDATAIGLAEDGQSFYCRGYKALVRYDGQGQPIWSKPLPLGRFPCPPTAAAGRVYACSDMGVLSVLDAVDGKVLWQYQVSPRLHVMAPVGVAPNGDICVAGMDGSVLRLRDAK